MLFLKFINLYKDRIIYTKQLINLTFSINVIIDIK